MTAVLRAALTASLVAACSGAESGDDAGQTTGSLTSPPDTACTSTTFGAHTYWFCSTTRSWATARSKCEAVGLNLVRIDTSAENDFVRARIGGLFDTAWIGANDTANEGVWRWSFDGSNFWNGGAFGSAVPGMFSKWAVLQPDNFLNQDCARIVPDGTWHDDYCSWRKRFVCESGADLCPNDPQKVEFGICGCGVPDVDSDGDGVLDCHEQCPSDPTKLVPGDCGCASSPRPVGTPCDDGLCAANTVCDGAGVCGNPSTCPPPDSHCRFRVARNTYYWFCDNDRPFANARQRCQSVGMDVAAVEDGFEDAFITSNIIEHSFIGGSDQTIEGEWVWLPTGVTFWTGGFGGSALAGAYTNWELLQPSDGLLGRDCMVKDPPIGHGKWETRSCTEGEAFVCEGEPAAGTPSQEFANTAPDGTTNIVGIPSGEGTPVTDYAVCEPGLDLVTAGNAPQTATTFRYTLDSSSPCAFTECNDDNSNPRTPSEADLNASPAESDVCTGLLPSLVCGIDPTTVDTSATGLCTSDATCITTGRVCAEVCLNESCTSTEHRCAKQKASCAGVSQETSCKDVRQCADVDYTGNSDPVDGAQLGIRPPNDLALEPDPPAELTNPDQSNLPSTYPKGDICNASVGDPAELPEQLEPREAHSGNTKWGIFAHPEVSFHGKMSPRPIGGEAALDFAADASFKGGAYVWGAEFEALEARASGEIHECEFEFARSLELFGAPIDIGPPGFQKRSDQCASLMSARGQLVLDVKFWLFKAQAVKDYVAQAGFTQELCQFTYGDADSPFVFLLFQPSPQCDLGCVDTVAVQQACSTAAGREGAAREWITAYANAVNAYFSNQQPLDEAKRQLSTELPATLELVNIHQRFGFAPPPITVPIGPVHVTVEIEMVGGWGVAGELGMVLDRNPRSRVGVQAQVVPDFDLTALAFAGVGIGPVTFGVGGELLLLDVEAPLLTGLHFTQVASDDTRPKDFPTAPTAFPTQKYRWNADWSLGSRVQLFSLDGSINLQARVRLLFFKKTFKKKIADWHGIHNTYDFLGAALPLASAPDFNFGDFGEETAYVDPGWLSTNLTGPTTPVSRPVPEDVLGVKCIEPPH